MISDKTPYTIIVFDLLLSYVSYCFRFACQSLADVHQVCVKLRCFYETAKSFEIAKSFETAKSLQTMICEICKFRRAVSPRAAGRDEPKRKRKRMMTRLGRRTLLVPHRRPPVMKVVLSLLQLQLQLQLQHQALHRAQRLLRSGPDQAWGQSRGGWRQGKRNRCLMRLGF